MIVHRFVAFVPLKSKINGKGTHKETKQIRLKVSSFKTCRLFRKIWGYKNLTEYRLSIRGDKIVIQNCQASRPNYQVESKNPQKTKTYTIPLPLALQKRKLCRNFQKNVRHSHRTNTWNK